MNATEPALKRVAPAIVPAVPASTDMPDSLAVLVEDLARRVEAGEPIDAEAFIATHAQHEEALRRLLPAIMALAEFGNSHDGPTVVDPLLGVTDDAGRLGDFRIVREIGRGGMGVVYEAEQISLSRRVALKVLPFAAILDDRQLKRFKLEATAAASLKHPNIVSVYCVGCERGVHFYAMEYVEGQTLAAVIEAMKGEDRGSRSEKAPGSAGGSNGVRVAGVEPAAADEPPGASADTVRVPVAAFSTLDPHSSLLDPSSRQFFRAVAELGIQAAEALDHAHQIGIVHRDIKPSNLMLESVASGQLSVVSGIQRTTNNGQRTTPKLYITDFGLAHIENNAGGATLTMTGDLLGTLRYMSPEQAEGHSAVLDHRTDIYSLGITLYELLTLRPAFPAENRQTLLKQIASDEPPVPRKLNKSIPADLETIILKAINKNPADRYPSAHHLADDLRRFLEQQPIKARRPSPIDRAKRWAFRHTALVAIAFAALILVAVSGITAAILIARAYNSKAKEHARAETNLRLAADSVDKMMTRVASDPKYIGNVHRAEQLISDAAEFHERLLTQNNDPEFVLRAVTTYRRAVWIRYLGGLPDKAESALRRASELLTKLNDSHPDRAEYRDALAHNELELGRVLWFVDQHSQAEVPLRHAIALYEDLVERSPSNSAYQLRLAEALCELAHFELHLGELGKSESYLARANDISKRLPKEAYDWHESFYASAAFRGYGPYESLRLEGALLHNEALLARDRKELDRAIELFKQAVIVQQRAYDLCSTDKWVHDDLFRHRWCRADTLLRASRYKDAAKAVEEMVNAFKYFQVAHHRGAELLLRCAELAESASGATTSLNSSASPSATVSASADGDAATESAAESYRNRARELIEKADKVANRSTVTQDHFAWFLLTCSDESFRDPDRALKLAQSITQTVPECASARRTLSLAHYRLGQWHAAHLALKKARLRRSP